MYRYRNVSNKKAPYRIDIVSSRKKVMGDLNYLEADQMRGKVEESLMNTFNEP